MEYWWLAIGLAMWVVYIVCGIRSRRRPDMNPFACPSAST